MYVSFFKFSFHVRSSGYSRTGMGPGERLRSVGLPVTTPAGL
jgi:hypothetical protein